MKAFIYYSHTGNGDVVAKYMEDHGYAVIKVSPERDLGTHKFFSILFGGLEALIGIKYRIKPYEFDSSLYDELVIGSPVWNGRPSCPGNTLLERYKHFDGSVKVIFYAGGGEGSHATRKVSKMFSNARSIILKEPKSHVEQLGRLNEFLKENPPANK